MKAKLTIVQQKQREESYCAIFFKFVAAAAAALRKWYDHIEASLHHWKIVHRLKKNAAVLQFFFIPASAAA